jgi:hypothetical protein
VHQVEGCGLQPGGEEIVVSQQYVAEAFVGYELFGRPEHGVVDVRPHHLTILSDPLAEQSKPAHHPASDIDGPETATVADFGQEPAAAGLPHPGLELEPLQLGCLTSQQICRRTHDVPLLTRPSG